MGINQGNMQSSMEKLSSGMRINKAGDDAAGLAISEKMRAQINGLDQASRNAQDGISMIQTAEGGLDETHSILQRMRELAVQSANDTNVGVDREEIQKEVDQLSQEISRIGDNTEFNTQNLLDGSLDNKFQIGANSGQNLSLSIDDMRGFELGVAGSVKTEQTDASVTALADGTYTIEGNTTDGLKLIDSNGDQVGQSADGKVWNDMQATAVEEFTFTQAVDSGSIKIDSSGATGTAELANTGLEAGDYTVNFVSGASTITDANGDVVAKSTDDTAFTNADGDTVLTLDAAATADMDISVGGIDVSSQASADSAITTINNAIENVSAERSKLGATQNRLEHTISNLDNSSENLSAAESRVRDVDMAKEMMEMTKANVLSQASQSMLAQANQQPQSVLQLLG
ncbi:flagellin [Salipaludibacillus sp. CF4.18]|uniref:flagellin N-terminal helical domain-containing protein n=1 Tax=Salipaludibacillus sp. CF4.18 TaxID=3373081 RepID=UPI003EE70A7D